MRRKLIFSILSAFLLLSLIACQGTRFICKSSADLAGSASGGRITIAWDSNTEPNLRGYRVFYGTSPGKYRHCVDVGKAAESAPSGVKYTLSGLVKGERYYIAVIAYPSNEALVGTSGYSNEVNSVAK